MRNILFVLFDTIVYAIYCTNHYFRNPFTTIFETEMLAVKYEEIKFNGVLYRTFV